MTLSKSEPIDVLWITMDHNLLKVYTPTAEIAADEQLLLYCGKFKFMQYIPSKPTKSYTN